MNPPPLAEQGLSPDGIAYVLYWLDAYCDAQNAMRKEPKK